MKITHYYNKEGIKMEISYDEMHPCLSCGEPVHNASMGGTVICPSCDLGRCRFCGMTIFVLKKEIDGGKSYEEVRRHMKRHRERLGLPERYTEEELHKAMIKENKSLNLWKNKLNISHRIGELELRRTDTLGGEKQYLEIVKWSKDYHKKDYCFTILIFTENNEDDYFIESVGDRINLEAEEWKDLGILIKIGFGFLNKLAIVKE